MFLRASTCVVVLVTLLGCGEGPRAAAARAGGSQLRAATAWRAIAAPPDNPVTQAKVELGFRLWFEPRLSGNQRMTCATCHHHTTGFSNAEPTAAGIHGQRGNRNVPTLYAAAGSTAQFWDGRAASLEDQALQPIENPIEMDARLSDVIRKLAQHPYYPQKFQQAFGTGVTADGMAKALASFERALRLKPSSYDRFLTGDEDALTAQQRRGLAIFSSARGRCVACHSGPDLTDRDFHNTGVGQAGPQADPGRQAVTHREQDRGAFKTPTLRNVARTGPYMHDGSLPTLEAVVAHYNRGGGPNPNLDPRLAPLGLTPEEAEDLVAFLRALSAADNLKELAGLPGIRNPRRPQEPLALPADLLP
ncbi:MAG: cytochrome c peroxidase [Candidatus Sericytochromatia bacterium]|nr:cytochrome c peroxidase [Candidatus Sericytochromatia bacterium]